MTKTLIDIPDDLMAAAQRAAGEGVSKSETVRIALRRMAHNQTQLEVLEALRSRPDAFGDLAEVYAARKAATSGRFGPDAPA